MTAHRIAAEAVEKLLNKDLSDYSGPFCQCSCGHMAQYRSRREKTIISVLGPIKLSRAYYHCQACGSSIVPRDAQLGYGTGGVSPAVERMMAYAAAGTSFGESAELMAELAGIKVTAKMIERSAEKTGDKISRDEKEHVVTSQPVAKTMYVGMDGSGTPMRPEELKGIRGKQPDGTAKTRETKLVSIWSAEGRTADGTPERDPGSISYSAAIESAAIHDTATGASEFAERVRREALRRGLYQAQRQVVLGDGAPWIWKLANELFPDAIQIVDRYHVKEHLAKTATAIFGPESVTGKEWRDARFQELDEGKLNKLIDAIRIHSAKNENARRCIEYIQTNAERMRYHQFREMGLCTSTGVLEAGCKIVVGKRLKQAGMRWTKRGANAILALRCYKLSGRLPSYWERLRQKRAA
jgi:hypothetical protein